MVKIHGVVFPEVRLVLTLEGLERIMIKQRTCCTMLQTADSLRNVLSSMFLALLNMRADAFSTRSLKKYLSQSKGFGLEIQKDLMKQDM